MGHPDDPTDGLAEGVGLGEGDGHGDGEGEGDGLGEGHGGTGLIVKMNAAGRAWPLGFEALRTTR